jgi:hypothetical protein
MTIVYREEVAVPMRIVFALALTVSLVVGLSLSHQPPVYAQSTQSRINWLDVCRSPFADALVVKQLLWPKTV